MAFVDRFIANFCWEDHMFWCSAKWTFNWDHFTISFSSELRRSQEKVREVEKVEAPQRQGRVDRGFGEEEKKEEQEARRRRLWKVFRVFDLRVFVSRIATHSERSAFRVDCKPSAQFMTRVTCHGFSLNLESPLPVTLLSTSSARYPEDDSTHIPWPSWPTMCVLRTKRITDSFHWDLNQGWICGLYFVFAFC